MLNGLGMEVFTGTVAIAFLVLGAEYLVMRCVKVAEYLGISAAFIGLTVISIGTSIPEIITHIVGSVNIVRGAIDPQVASATVLGANIGSDIIQQNFIIGIVALIGTVVASKKFLKRDYYIMIGAAMLLWLFSLGGFISPFEGFLLAGGYIAYMWVLWKDESHHRENTKKSRSAKRNLFIDAVLIVIFLAVVVVSADHILRVSEVIVEHFSIGGSLIGVLIVGICTALPEFTTSVVAVLKHNASLSIGTLVGSNITNPMFALGIGALISGYSVPTVITWFDLPVKIITSLMILWFLWRGKEVGISKFEATAMIGMYVAYIVARMYFFPADVFLG